MIKFSDSVFLALNLDNDGAIFSPVKGGGDAHVLTVPSAERPGVDVLALATDGRVRTVCNRRFKASNLTPGLSRNLCKACAGFLASKDHGVERERVLSLVPAVMEEGPGGIPVAAVSVPAVVKLKGREIDAVARLTDGKCAYPVIDDEGNETLTPVHGRSKIEPVPGTVTVMAGVGKGEAGVCPFCRTEVKLTGSGFLSTHRPGNERPDRPQLSQKSIPAVERGVPVADEARKREAESRDGDGNAVVETADNAGAAVGNRDHGRIDGVAMTAGDLPPVQPQKGWAAKVGTTELPVGRARPDKRVVREVMHGDGCPCSKDGKRRRGAYLTCKEYRALPKRQQRRYWEHLSTIANRAKAARQVARNKREALGEEIPRAERKRLRKAAKVGSAAEGTVHGRVYSVR
jgi:hypothetical protein